MTKIRNANNRSPASKLKNATDRKTYLSKTSKKPSQQTNERSVTGCGRSRCGDGISRTKKADHG